MNSLKIPLCHIHMFFMLGGTYETIETVKQARNYRLDKCKLYIDGKTYSGLILYDKYRTAIVDILEDGSYEDCYADFRRTYEELEKTIPREEITLAVGKYLVYKYMVYVMRLVIVMGFVFFWYTGRATCAADYVFSACFIILVFAFSRPLLIYSTRNLYKLY